MSSKWAVRDVAHGKTFSFESFEEMLEWFVKMLNQCDDVELVINEKGYELVY